MLAAAIKKLAPTSASPWLDAELLLARVLDVERSYLFAHPEDTMDSATAERFSTLMLRRASGYPMAYIMGEKEFWSMTLTVSPETLIPRPETEIIVAQTLQRIPLHSEMEILDLGTGTGAVGLAIARERPLCHVVATDISAKALAVARVNSHKLGVPNIEFVLGNWLEPVASQKFDLIVSNPPYIASDDPHLADLEHEPICALEAGADGLDAIRKIVFGAGKVMKYGGHLILEHGAEQANDILEMYRAGDWTDISDVKDYAGMPRVVIAIYNQPNANK